MKTLQRPETELFCSCCDFHDESWKFSATGGDDVEYRCPKCSGLAALTKPTKIEEQNIMGIKPIKPIDQTPNIFPNFIVADFEKATTRIMSEKEAASSDGDVLLPMVTLEQLESMPKHMRRTWEQQYNVLCDAVETGRCPILPEIEQWAASLSPESTEEAEIVEGDADDLEDSFEDDEDFAEEFENVSAFEAGFQAGVNFCLMEKLFEKYSINNQPEAETKAPVKMSVEKKQQILAKLSAAAAQKGARR